MKNRMSDTEMQWNLSQLGRTQTGELALQYLNQKFDRDSMRKAEEFFIANAYVDGFKDAEYHQTRRFINKLIDLVQSRYNRNEKYWGDLLPDQKTNCGEAEYRAVRTELGNLLKELKQL